MADDLLQMFQSITTSDHDELVDQFAHLLALDPNTATFFLESSNWNVETAVNNYLATMEPSLHHESQRAPPHQHQPDDLAMDDDEGNEARPTIMLPSAFYDAQFVSDLSAAQNTIIPPGTDVDMVWSFVNTGSAQWPVDTHLVFGQGDRFDGPLQIPVPPLEPGARIDLSVRLRTPIQSGSFSGSWRLVSPEGPIGEPMWVVLNVSPSKQQTFHALAGTEMPVAAAASGGTDDDMMDL